MSTPSDTLAGKNALVTDGVLGVGKMSAKLFAYLGAQIAILGRHISKLKSMEQDIAAICKHKKLVSCRLRRRMAIRSSKKWQP